MQLLVPKTTSTVITDVVIENLVRDSITTTALVAASDAAKQGYKPAMALGECVGTRGAGQGRAGHPPMAGRCITQLLSRSLSGCTALAAGAGGGGAGLAMRPAPCGS